MKTIVSMYGNLKDEGRITSMSKNKIDRGNSESDELIHLLKTAKAMVPEQRLCQIISNALTHAGKVDMADIFYCEDRQLIKNLKDYIKSGCGLENPSDTHNHRSIRKILMGPERSRSIKANIHRDAFGGRFDNHE